MPARGSILVSVALACSLLLAGCLERYEAITIRPDGGAVLRSEFRGTPEDFKKTADALPEPGGAWSVTERQEQDKDGKPRTIRVAELTLAPGAQLPNSYAAPGDARFDSALRFPTGLKVTRAAGMTHFDFSRSYARRDEAVYTYLKKKLTQNDEFKALEGKDPSTYTPEQRAKVLRTLALLDADKHVRFIEVAAAPLEADGSWPQEIALTLRRAAIDYAERFDTGAAEKLLAQPQTPERDKAMNEMAAAFTEGLHQAVKDALAKFSVTDEQRERYKRAVLAERAKRVATEDLADERWEVRLTMPGTVTAHNADRVENGVLVWEFGADAIMDRNHVIAASSVAK